MKLNCDLGESFGAWKMGLDDQVMPHIDMANIACGFHAAILALWPILLSSLNSIML